MIIEVAGRRIAATMHVAAGGPPPVLFLPGVTTSPDLGRELFVAPERESWLSLSLPGHHPAGGPPAPGGEHLTSDTLADGLEAACRTLLGDRPVVATGWSLGGHAALALAVRHPARVAAVASLAGFARGDRGVSGIIGWLTWLAAGRGRPLVRAGLARAGRSPLLHGLVLWLCAGPAGGLPPRAARRRLHAAFRRHDPAALAEVLAAIRRLDLDDRLSGIGVPAWIAAGARDPVIPRAETGRLASAVPAATLRLYAGGHLFFRDWPGFREDFAAWRRMVCPG